MTYPLTITREQLALSYAGPDSIEVFNDGRFVRADGGHNRTEEGTREGTNP